jgi:hypothetical protein
VQQLDYATLTNLASVAANRGGALSSEQRIRLEREAQRSGLPVAVGMVVVGVGFMVPLLFALGVFGASVGAPISAVCAAPIALIGVGLLVLAFVAFKSQRRISRLLREDLAGSVEQGEGEVYFTRRGYAALLDPRPRPGTPIVGPLERPLPSRPVQLPPGRYRFFFLPRSRTLLSAEPLTPMAAGAAFPAAADPLLGLPDYQPAPTPYLAEAHAAFSTLPQGALGALQHALAEGNRFTLDDLAANRAGRLSGRQARRLLAPLIMLAPVCVPFVVIGAGVLYLALTESMLRPSGLVIGITFTGGGLLMLAYALSRVADTLGREVRSIAGIVTAERDSSGDSTTFRYKVNKMKFQVSGLAYTALISGLAYRIYYTPRSKTLVSIEPFGSDHV